jgi:ribonuclease T2
MPLSVATIASCPQRIRYRGESKPAERHSSRQRGPHSFRQAVGYLRVALLALLILPATWAWASTAAQGTLTAQQPCEAYVSKNRRTNPDHSTLTVGTTYAIFEVNRGDQPDWYRVRVDTAQPPERWVSAQCGTAQLQVVAGGGGNGSGGSSACHTAGLAENFKLALSWQPAFCEDHPSKPECAITDTQTYQARNFTLHGLWPNKSSCGINYDYCGEVTRQPGDMCDYPALQLYTAVKEALKTVMPSAAAGSCLERHEWHKHGTCQSQWSIDEYFEHSVDLTRQFNESGVAYYMARRIGQTVSEEEFLNRVDCALGSGARQRVQLNCVDGNLVDIYINLPAQMAANEDLGALMSRAEPSFRSNCNGRFRIDPIGLGH